MRCTMSYYGLRYSTAIQGWLKSGKTVVRVGIPTRGRVGKTT
jgi:hypothetical protein